MNSTLMSILMVMTSLMLISVIKVCLSSLADYSLCFFFLTLWVCIRENILKLYDIFSAEAVNITLVDNFESGLVETDVFNRFER